MFLIVGLGNPGKEYENTRHNAGFMTVDALADEYGFAPLKSKFDGVISEGKIEGEKVYLLKPHTYMNLSGNSVVKAANFYYLGNINNNKANELQELIHHMYNTSCLNNSEKDYLSVFLCEILLTYKGLDIGKIR
jgi:aminoacyl-tRNA hydrolase